jgi:hypothetical protein
MRRRQANAGLRHRQQAGLGLFDRQRRLSGTPAAGNAGTYSNIVIRSRMASTASLPAFGITVAAANRARQYPVRRQTL